MVAFNYARELDLVEHYEQAIEIGQLGWQSCTSAGSTVCWHLQLRLSQNVIIFLEMTVKVRSITANLIIFIKP